MEKVIVTGATGFIGSRLVKKLVYDGHDVSIIVRPSSNLRLIKHVNHMVRSFVFDGTMGSLLEAFATVRPTTVFHLASLFRVEHASEDICPMISSNVLFGTQVLEAGSKYGLTDFINTGTHWQHYNGADYNPVNLYAATKKAFEMVAKYYLETTPLRMVTINLFDTYGPNDPRPKVMSVLKNASRSGAVIDMSPGEQELGLVYIDDVVRGFMIAFRHVKGMKEHEQQSYDVAPLEVHTLKEVADIFARVSGKKLNINWGMRPYRRREMMKLGRQEHNLLYGLDAVDLTEGIAKMLDTERKSAGCHRIANRC